MLSRPVSGRHLGTFIFGAILCAMSASNVLAQSAPLQGSGTIQISDAIQIDGKPIEHHNAAPIATFQVIDIAAPYDESLLVPSPAELRKKYPYESIAPRLKYESARAARQNVRVRPKLGPVARKQLTQADASFPEEADVRAKSLEMLHSDKVDEFVTKQGFGVGRMITIEPSPRFLSYPESPPLVFNERPSQSGDSQSRQVVILPERGVLEESGGAWTPSIDLLSDFHANDRSMFASLASFGHIKDRQHVAGFRSHGFAWIPYLGHPQNDIVDNKETHPEHWKIGRLELVSLLKHEKPAVYLSEHLPRMEELKDAKTRPLSAFEKSALEKLLEGEEIVTEARTNDIQMVGALRASKQCLKCHQATHGELLGAFSYDLFRDPPVKGKARSVVPPT